MPPPIHPERPRVCSRKAVARLLAAVILAFTFAPLGGTATLWAQGGAAKSGSPGSAAASDPTVAAADRGRITGAESAPIWVLIVSDFQCPYCRQWHKESWDILRREYVATGKIRVAYVNFPLGIHPNARPAAVAAMCASAQGRFWEFADLVFDTQDRWKDLKDAAPFFDDLARRAGLDRQRQRTCTQAPGIRSLVEADYVRMSRAGAQSTPTFFVGRTRIEGAQPIGQFRRAIEAELAAARRP